MTLRCPDVLGIVSMGKFIDTLSLSHSLFAGETVNCCQHVKAIGNSRYHNSFVDFFHERLLLFTQREKLPPVQLSSFPAITQSWQC